MDKSQLKDFIVNKFKNIPYQIIDGTQIYWQDAYGYINCYENKFRDFSNCSWIDNGVSKIVFYFDECPNYVFKIPFIGDYTVKNEAELDNLESICHNNKFSVDINVKNFNRFMNANKGIIDEVSNNDYCAIESYLWSKACEKHVDDFFAETFFVCDFLNCPIYASEYLPHNYFDENDMDQASKKSMEIVSTKNKNNCSEMSNEMLAVFIDQYGERRVDDLISFINQYDIFDLHEENVGFDSYNNIKILDYSSFRN